MGTLKFSCLSNNQKTIYIYIYISNYNDHGYKTCFLIIDEFISF